LYFDATRGHLSQYRRWLLPIYRPEQEQGKGPVQQGEMRIA